MLKPVGTNNGTVGTNNGTIQGDASSDPELTENEKRIVLELVKSPALTYTDLTEKILACKEQARLKAIGFAFPV